MVATASVAACAACHGGTGSASSSRTLMLPSLDASRFVWLDAECSDGPLDLGSLGFERELRLHVEKTTLVMSFDTALAAQGCSSTSVFVVEPAPQAGLFRFDPRAFVTLPADQKCGASEREPTLGRLRSFGDDLEITLRRSPWCRGFDARFTYRRAEWQRLDDRQLVMHYVAAWNRGDPAAMAGLFDQSGSLVEPFTKTDDGNYARHQGREQVEAWYRAAFGGSPWHAMRLLSLSAGNAAGQWIATWEYMDPRLAAPLRGRNLFVLAGGEIYETEIQLVDDPQAAPEPAARAEGAP
ncbi:MAG: nuclear transport factor 2 family protein [Polyangiales bacterium]